MKLFVKIVSIYLLYILTVPTNVMCLGPFMESWLTSFKISREVLTCIYTLSTLCVFGLFAFCGIFNGIRKSLLFLAAACGVLSLGYFGQLPMFVMAFIFVILQWIGQGCLVKMCRWSLLKNAPTKHYGKSVGIMEALGTVAIFLCPFLELKCVHQLPWTFWFVFLALLYGIAAVVYPFLLESGQEDVHFLSSCDRRFIMANFLIYLPVVFSSGLFFHLESFCKTYAIAVDQLGLYTIPQVLCIILAQVLFGFLWRKTWQCFLVFGTLLLLSQVALLASLIHFNPTIYILSGAIGWGSFGILINGVWPLLYEEEALIESHLQAAVSVGFLANALGPCLFYFFVQ